MRLIDADELIKCLDYCAWNDATEVVNAQPTAYDVEKVVAELEEEREYSYADFDEYAYAYELDLKDEHDNFFFKGLARAIDIVKKGGVE